MNIAREHRKKTGREWPKPPKTSENLKIKNLRKCLPICCATCKHLNKHFGLGGVKCKLDDGPYWGRDDLVDVHYQICDEYYEEP